MNEDQIGQSFLALIIQVFPNDVRSRFNLQNDIELNDFVLRGSVVNYFQNKAWGDVDFEELYTIFKEDCSVAFYSLPYEERLIFIPAILKYSVIDECNIPGFEYVLENVLLGGDVDEFEGVAKDLGREQLAVALSILTYNSVKQWELPDCRKLKRIRSVVEGLQRSL